MFCRIKEEEFKVSRWDGGITKQLAIAPDGADYGKRDFLWRVSSAEVSLEESDFTHLPDYDRFLSVLEGQVVLNHGDGQEICLSPGTVYEFDGGIATHSRGTCTDFNLMVKKGACKGMMKSFFLKKGECAQLPAAEETVVYVAFGAVKAGAELYKKRDAFRASGEEEITLECVEEGLVIAACIL